MEKDILYIVIPAYNEEETIEEVVKEWHEVVQKIGNESKLVIINDGSKDSTKEKLEKMEKDYPCLIALTKKNGGHGDTVLYGYNYAIENKADYVFQTDSDGQTVAEEFWDFWKERNNHSAIIGHRNKREDGFSRVIVTKVLKLVLFLIFHLKVTDANTPFRLIKRTTLEKYYPLIPAHFNLSNVMLTVLMLNNKEDVEFKPITFRPRQGGVNSINIKKIVKIGKQAVKDFRKIRKTLRIQRKEKGIVA